MAVKIGHASIDENGKIVGGKAGDQTGRELCTRNWYNKGWNKVIRAKDSSVAEKIAVAMEKACANNNIGYDQTQRTTLYTQAKAKGWDIAEVTTKCECDCSSLVAVCVNASGIAVSKDIYTGNEAKALKATGAFTVLTASKYLNADTYLQRGDILLKEGSHTAVVLSNGSGAVESKPVVTDTTSNMSIKVGDIVAFTGCLHYTSSYSSGVARACKAGLAKVTKISKGKPHPYHLKAVAGKGATVNGWVNEADVKGTSSGKTYKVTAGDTLSKIAKEHNTTVNTLVALNGIKDKNAIRAGQVIILP